MAASPQAPNETASAALAAGLCRLRHVHTWGIMQVLPEVGPYCCVACLRSWLPHQISVVPCKRPQPKSADSQQLCRAASMHLQSPLPPVQLPPCGQRNSVRNSILGCILEGLVPEQYSHMCRPERLSCAGTPRSLSSPLSMSPRAHLSPRTREAAHQAASPEQRRRASFSDVPRSPAASHRSSIDRRTSIDRPSARSPPAPSVSLWCACAFAWIACVH